jgi:hypothetical protein
MTESEWNACTDPAAMLEHLRGRSSDRKCRLFACACCRRIWDRFPDPANRELVAVVEEHPDGQFHDPPIEQAGVASSDREWDCGGDPAYWVAKYLGRGFYKLTALESAFVVASKVALLADEEAMWDTDVQAQLSVVFTLPPFRLPSPLPAAGREEARTQAAFLRDIFGPLPFRSLRFAAAWRTPTVLSLAQEAYEKRIAPDLSLPGWFVLDPVCLAVLGDALEEIGVNPVLIDHLRGPGPHVRGCHVVDLILGRE